jgi:uncharacterized protein
MSIKTLQRLVAIMILAYTTLCALAGVFLAEVTLHPGRRVESSNDEMQARNMAWRHNYWLTDAMIRGKDGVTLRAWSIRPHQSNGQAVILLHGLGDNRIGMTGYAELLLSRGFSVILPDARAHGLSGGNLSTFGLLESDDIHRWVDWLELNDHPDCVFGLGESMGAAQLLQSLQSETRFCAVAAESPFATFREIGYDRIGQFFSTGPGLGRWALRPIIEFAFAYSAWKYKLHFEQASPEKVVAETRIPVFLIHGQIDSNIPVRHSRLIAAGNRAVVLWEVPNTDHCGAVGRYPEEFNDRLIRWFESHGRRGENRVAVDSELRGKSYFFNRLVWLATQIHLLS